MPVQQSYWPQVFPAVILMSFCPDLVFTAAQIIASNAVLRSQQGVAASLVGVLLLYGNSIGLGFAGTIEMQVDASRRQTVEGYRAALWFGCGIALLALVLGMYPFLSEFPPPENTFLDVFEQILALCACRKMSARAGMKQTMFLMMGKVLP